MLIEELEHEKLIVVTHAARTIELLGKKAKGAKANGSLPQEPIQCVT